MLYGIPFVLVNRRIDDLDTDYVIGDLQDGVQQVVAHLAQLGHRRIAFIGGQMNRFPVRERWLGYCQGLAAHGIPYDPALTPMWDEKMDTVGDCVTALLANPQRPTAIVSYNDWIAPAILHTLHVSGLRVPEDMSVVGYDDLPIAQYLLPALTSMTQPGYEIGQTGAAILLERLRLKADAPWSTRHILFKSKLVVRQSTGPLTAQGCK